MSKPLTVHQIVQILKYIIQVENKFDVCSVLTEQRFLDYELTMLSFEVQTKLTTIIYQQLQRFKTQLDELLYVSVRMFLFDFAGTDQR